MKAGFAGAARFAATTFLTGTNAIININRKALSISGFPMGRSDGLLALRCRMHHNGTRGNGDLSVGHVGMQAHKVARGQPPPAHDEKQKGRSP